MSNLNAKILHCDHEKVGIKWVILIRGIGLWNFRTSAAHAEDTKYVIAELRKMFDIPVWLIGTSMGTVSAANAAGEIGEGVRNIFIDRGGKILLYKRKF